MNPLEAFLINRLGLVFFLLKSVLHWMFGLSFFFLFSSSKVANRDWGSPCNHSLQYPRTLVQISNLSGRIRTLANLVDEWLPMMWWGHKEDGTPYCHARTSNHPLPGVKMDCVYAGSDAVSHPAIPGEVPAVETILDLYHRVESG
ncbi:uncharacterized protein EDB91DRAFT_1305728 [Suillus paluster]|uniref:uncharacterized protein n=1 Tax=Suillus paluster TaxID=48578 RepID=UPI001B8672FD|nr:uncharacterized protein EDB91DRAFT_1305728 [Suillus paluster]KAG1731484.1 hypothetical protein EDB91DRAFT_1305728 [Suillus paluster]